MALVPFAVFVHRLPPGPHGASAAFRGGLLLGVLQHGLLLHWMLVALSWVSVLALPAWAAAVLLLGGLCGAAGWALHRIVHARVLPLWLALAAVWTALEWVRASLPGGLGFPWLDLGVALAGWPELAGVAELVGSRGVAAWVALVNGCAVGVVLRIQERRTSVPAWTALTVALALPAGWGVWRAGTLELRPAARVAVVQPGVAVGPRADRLQAARDAIRAADSLLASIEPGSVDLVVLPEGFVPTYLEARPDLVESLTGLARRAGAPLLVGSFRYEARGPDSYVPFNSAFLVDDGGLTGFAYDKRRLVPVVERVPFVPPRRAGAATASGASARPGRPPGFGSLGRGVSEPLGEAADNRFGVLICYESAFAGLARGYRRLGADFLVNITNDGWFWREPWYSRTAGVHQHPAHLVLRAVETRTGIARSAATGISLVVDPLGRVSGAMGPLEAGLRVTRMATTDVRTLYVRTGDLAGPGAALACLLSLLLSGGGARPGGSRRGSEGRAEMRFLRRMDDRPGPGALLG